MFSTLKWAKYKRILWLKFAESSLQDLVVKTWKSVAKNEFYLHQVTSFRPTECLRMFSTPKWAKYIRIMIPSIAEDSLQDLVVKTWKSVAKNQFYLHQVTSFRATDGLRMFITPKCIKYMRIDDREVSQVSQNYLEVIWSFWLRLWSL